MKYNQNLTEAQKLIPNAKSILIALPTGASIDLLAAGLALYLSLIQTKKEVSIIMDGPVLVGHTSLFGAGQIQNRLPQSSNGNFVLTLGGVANPNDPQRPIPSVVNMDYKAEGTDLKLIFNVVPGMSFEPTHITPSREGGKFDLVFVIGVINLNLLGNIYTTNQSTFSGVHLINIDNNPANAQFGASNVIDPAASSLSEIMAQVLPGLALPIDADIAANILAGIYIATDNLQSGNVSADTFLVVAEAMRAGGKKPAAPTLPNQQAQAFSDAFTMPPVVTPQATPSTYRSSPEERPAGEGLMSEGEVINPEPDWLTPKIFKGGGLG